MTQTLDLDEFAIRRPPHLSPEDFIPCVPVVDAEIKRLREARTRAIDKAAYVQLVLAEAWLGHLDELYVSARCPPFRGDARVYLDRIAIDAARHIHGFLTESVPVWGPMMQHPRFGGHLHRAVARLVGLRAEARGGGCETCHAAVCLELHHLHYRSFGYELPSDVMRLCRDCHQGRHRLYGWPKDVSWQDGWRWSIYPGEGGRDVGGG